MVNSMVLQGRLAADIDLRHTMSNVPYTEFTVAWSERYKDVETKCFLRCKAWRSTAEFLSKYFRKGQELVINGRMVTEQWSADGEAKSRTICQVDGVSFCGKKEGMEASGGHPKEAPGKASGGFMEIPEGAEDDIPFR